MRGPVAALGDAAETLLAGRVPDATPKIKTTFHNLRFPKLLLTLLRAITFSSSSSSSSHSLSLEKDHSKSAPLFSSIPELQINVVVGREKLGELKLWRRRKKKRERGGGQNPQSPQSFCQYKRRKRRKTGGLGRALLPASLACLLSPWHSLTPPLSLSHTHTLHCCCS